MRLKRGHWLRSKITTASVIAVVLLATGGPVAFAQKAGEPETIIELSVSAAAEPSPVFKHRLTVLPHRAVPGNSALTYMAAFAEGGLRIPWKRIEDTFGYDGLNFGYSDSKATKEELIQAASEFDDLIDHFIRRASRQRRCEWDLGMEYIEGAALFSFPLSNAQETRSISRAIGLQTRAAIAEGDFDKAVELMGMNYKLGGDVAKIPAMVASLVGIAEVSIANDSMQELIGAEGSPNMYWALTELPDPIIDVRTAMRVETQWAERLIPELAEVDRKHSDAGWKSLYERVVERVARGIPNQLENYASSTGRSLMPFGFGIASYRSSKKRMIATGIDKAEVEAMSVAEVLLKDAAHEAKRLGDLCEKQTYMSFQDAMRFTYQVENELRLSESISNPGAVLTGLILPATQQVLAAQMRVRRDICAFRVIEAIRMHAAQTGALPLDLDEISLVPAPDNPATGKPFEYRIDDSAAVLDLSPWPGALEFKRYIIRLRQ